MLFVDIITFNFCIQNCYLYIPCCFKLYNLNSEIFHIRRAYQHVKNRPNGMHLCLDKLGYYILWAGHLGLHIQQVIYIIIGLMNCQRHPTILVPFPLVNYVSSSKYSYWNWGRCYLILLLCGRV